MKQFNIYNYTEPKELKHIEIGYVYHNEESQEAVASSWHIMVASKKHYNPELAGKLINKKGDTLKGGNFTYAAGRMRLFPADIVLLRDFRYTIEMNDVLKALENTKNFLDNVPDTWADGCKIHRKDRTITIGLKMTDGKEERRIFFRYENLKKFVDAIGPDGSIVAKGGIYAIYGESKDREVRAILMPVCCGFMDQDIDDAFTTGIFSQSEKDAKMEEKKFGEAPSYKGLYIGVSLITAYVTSYEAACLFAKPEKKVA